ncbi:acyl carrier protein [Pseudomonas sp. NFACC48-1]|nr:acyl carrier protein [Pseudomonas sp. NFACC05-1]SCZ41353.1 acyl carrier protein [Pseudomonas sp. NFACC44-2]SDA89436.1 acyl carrier protein [Pseudomonas sp. NFACC51]SEJ97072.1 acyl carrier protein [Pseudomonas sp. NFACC07-1]SFI31249.1 acyl carrier protein [Pseudomonas sp. NFACC54]SFL57724.1 acyl carrier protein [Pseudomonas sp. NFACC46-3]SFT27096.1 acyl carrier protein [Pseudomonas sp. NFACC48-1]
MGASVTEMCIESEVIKLLSGYFSTIQRKISRHSRLVEDLNLDSVDVVEIIMIVDEAFNVELPSHEVEAWRSVADIIHSVEAARGA